jgi:hypothetical protein
LRTFTKDKPLQRLIFGSISLFAKRTPFALCRFARTNGVRCEKIDPLTKAAFIKKIKEINDFDSPFILLLLKFNHVRIKEEHQAGVAKW